MRFNPLLPKNSSEAHACITRKGSLVRKAAAHELLI